jgi:hypothetical protein
MIAHANDAARTHGWAEAKEKDVPEGFLNRERGRGGGRVKGVWVRGDQIIVILDNARYYKTDGQKYCVWRGTKADYEACATDPWYAMGMACVGSFLAVSSIERKFTP